MGVVVGQRNLLAIVGRSGGANRSNMRWPPRRGFAGPVVARGCWAWGVVRRSGGAGRTSLRFASRPRRNRRPAAASAAPTPLKDSAAPRLGQRRSCRFGFGVLRRGVAVVAGPLAQPQHQPSFSAGAAAARRRIRQPQLRRGHTKRRRVQPSTRDELRIRRGDDRGLDRGGEGEVRMRPAGDRRGRLRLPSRTVLPARPAGPRRSEGSRLRACLLIRPVCGRTAGCGPPPAPAAGWRRGRLSGRTRGAPRALRRPVPSSGRRRRRAGTPAAAARPLGEDLVAAIPVAPPADPRPAEGPSPRSRSCCWSASRSPMCQR